MKSVSVYPSATRRGSWAVKLNTDMVPMAIRDTQYEAIRIGREYLQANGGGELVIHGEDGRIRSKDTIEPAHDPRSIRG